MSEAKVADQSPSVMALAANIVQAYLSRNSVPLSEVPSLLRSVHDTLTGLTNGQQAAIGTAAKPAVPIKRSVMPDYIVCLEDGKRLTMLKRYLRSHYNMTPEEYRARWNLPHDYPMVAPNYSTRRSEFAKKIGLGRQTKGPRRRRRS